MSKLYVGEIGKKIILNTAADVSASSVRKIYYKKPTGTTGNWSAAQESSTSISYTTTAAGDLDVAGTWKFQAYVEKGSWKLPGTIAEQDVDATLY